MTGGYDAIVLAGGRSGRMSGQPKPQLRIGEQTMLELVLAAVSGAETRVVVGPPQPVPGGVLLVQEDPQGCGPVAGLAAGLARTSAELVAVIAADLPFLTPQLIEALVSGLGRGVDVALVVDEIGREQYLLGAWRTGRLRTALAELEPLPGRAMRELLAPLRVARLRVPTPDGAPAPWTDIDTPAELDRARDNVAPPTQR